MPLFPDITEYIILLPPKDGHSYFVLSDGDYDSACPEVEHLIQLIRLGSERSEQSCDPLVQPDIADSEFIYVNTPPEVGSRYIIDLFELLM